NVRERTVSCIFLANIPPYLADPIQTPDPFCLVGNMQAFSAYMFLRRVRLHANLAAESALCNPATPQVPGICPYSDPYAGIGRGRKCGRVQRAECAGFEAAECAAAWEPVQHRAQTGGLGHAILSGLS